MLKQTKEVELRKYIARKGFFVQLEIPESFKSLEPEIRLGRSILDRALLDCLEDPEIEECFDTDNERFLDVCLISWLEPEDVIDKFQKTLKRLKNKETIQDIYKEIE